MSAFLSAAYFIAETLFPFPPGLHCWNLAVLSPCDSVVKILLPAAVLNKAQKARTCAVFVQGNRLRERDFSSERPADEYFMFILVPEPFVPERFPSLPLVRNVEIAVMTSALLPAVACPKRKSRLSGLVFRLFPLAKTNAILPAAVLYKARKLRSCRSSVCLVEIRIKMCKRKIYKVIKRKAVCCFMFRTRCTPH